VKYQLKYQRLTDYYKDNSEVLLVGRKRKVNVVATGRKGVYRLDFKKTKVGSCHFSQLDVSESDSNTTKFPKEG